MGGTTAGGVGVLALVALGVACAAGNAGSVGGWTDGGTSAQAEAGTIEDAGGASPTGAPPIYVATTGSDTAAGTSPTTPVQTIQAGLDLAAACPGAPCVVLVAAGTYPQSLQLRDGVSLYGQYAPDFSARAAANGVTVTSSDAETVVANGLTKATTVDGVTIQGASFSTTDGRSTYAVWVHASRSALFLSNDAIVGGVAAAGAPGAPGGALTCDSTGGAGGTSDDCDSNPGGSGSASGDPANAGDGGGGGSCNCPDACPLVNSDGVSSGTPGAPGGAGASGAGGDAAPDIFGAFSGGLWTGAAGGAGARGMHGTGGGGGGSGGTKRFVACFGCSTLLGGNGTAGGAGGCAGAGGGPGGAGGGSFALVVDSNVTLSNVTVTGGTGGAGGAGGAGAPGQPGIVPDAEAPGAAAEQECGLIDYESGAGATGGAGGAGGSGGGGAGGVGGPSVAAVTTNGGQITQYGATTFTAGTPGAGGAGGGGASVGAVGLTGGVATLRAY
jgi:hypothetical protein